jgi:hypothetical protein
MEMVTEKDLLFQSGISSIPSFQFSELKLCKISTLCKFMKY